MRHNILFNNSYSQLPQRYFAHALPVHVRDPHIVKLNVGLAAELGVDIDALTPDILSGNTIPDGAEPIACVYAGHQFGQFSPQLGDGRAILLGEVIDIHGNRRDIQLKGSGSTPFSRRGDGRATLGSVLREYIISEAMFALDVPTTRSLACVTTGEGVVRESILAGAVLTRVAASHIRVGTFQYFAARGDTQAVKTFADYVIARHYPECLKGENPYAALLIAVVCRQAKLIAQWMNIGFIHGVMNTDNMSIAGETIDYGPCAFMDMYDPNTVFSAIDSNGRYAYGNQPRIAQWNLSRLAETLIPLVSLSEAQTAIDGFGGVFEQAYFGGLRAKLGLINVEEGDDALIQDLLVKLAQEKADYTLFFTNLPQAPADDWVNRWQLRIAREPDYVATMKRANPVYIPRNYLVEEALAAAVVNNDYAPFETLLEVLAKPFTERAGFERFMQPPLSRAGRYYTFCGT